MIEIEKAKRFKTRYGIVEVVKDENGKEKMQFVKEEKNETEGRKQRKANVEKLINLIYDSINEDDYRGADHE